MKPKENTNLNFNYHQETNQFKGYINVHRLNLKWVMKLIWAENYKSNQVVRDIMGLKTKT